ncbi:Anaphase-promoting complex (APC), subunit 11 [Handroanthus impetiginosus]|uniref:RING-type E3 ubiquitin transferase n=1 Tax=Handroanthus impetiginosus TaxID=429701 RepID=A0A2G9G9S3_9LAMI|nr:Anaphase-promoting complex (APC), subunit 11 [Handroanthus impetiginosus]
MRTSNSMLTSETSDDISRCELGLKKELREMLPIIVFKESFSVKDTQCSVCLGDYQAEDRLQQIPACGHTFHMDCIDLWLTTHTTCPLCRQSLLASNKALSTQGVPDTRVEANSTASHGQIGGEMPRQDSSQTNEEPQTSQQSGDRDERIFPAVGERHRDVEHEEEVERDMENAK